MIIGLDVLQKFGIEKTQEITTVIESFLNNSNLEFPEGSNVVLKNLTVRISLDGEELFITKDFEL